jgi:hypothetical protein
MAQRYDGGAPKVAQMKKHLRVAAAALIVLGVTTACQKTTEGSVAMTTEPGPPIPSATGTPGAPGMPGMPGLPGLPGIPIPSLPLPGNSNVPEVPPPPNALTMKCSEFNDLDEATRLAVIREILKQGDNPLGPEGASVGQMLVEAACQFLPDATVNEVLLGGSPP